MKKVVAIINPISGTTKKAEVESKLKSILTRFELIIEKTEFAGHAHTIATKYANEDCTVLAIGGDGTVQEVGSALLHKQARLGIIPMGSGNGMARCLNIPLNTVKAIELIKYGSTKTVDTYLVDEKPCIGMMGIGFDAHIAHAFSSFGKRGFTSYLYLIIKEYFGYKEKEFLVSIDGKDYTKNAFLLSIANSNQYGNGGKISPISTVDDGLLEACFLRKPNFFLTPFFALGIFFGFLHKTSILEIIKGKHFVVKNNFEIYHTDGEPKMASKPIEINVMANSLKVITI